MLDDVDPAANVTSSWDTGYTLKYKTGSIVVRQGISSLDYVPAFVEGCKNMET